MGRKAYIKGAVQELGLSEYQIRWMLRNGKLPALRSGNRWILDIEQCQDYLKKEALKNTEPEEAPKLQYGVLRKIGI